MTIPTREECIELLHKHKIKESKLVHTLLVEKVAVFIGKKLIEQGEKVNIDILSRAALLHDIGKHEARETGKEHALAGSEICQREGIDENICKPIKIHALEAVEGPLETWEEKVLLYADKIVKHDIIGVDKRFSNWDEKEKKFAILNGKNIENKREKYKSKIKQLENQILNKANITFEDIRGINDS